MLWVLAFFGTPVGATGDTWMDVGIVSLPGR